MRKTICVFVLAVLYPVAGVAAEPYRGGIEVSFPERVVSGGNVVFRAVVDAGELRPGRRSVVELVPVVSAAAGDRERRFGPVVVMGRQRALLAEREELFGGVEGVAGPAEVAGGERPLKVIVAGRKNRGKHEIEVEVKYEGWMRGARFAMVETCVVCGGVAREYPDGATYRVHAAPEVPEEVEVADVGPGVVDEVVAVGPGAVPEVREVMEGEVREMVGVPVVAAVVGEGGPEKVAVAEDYDACVMFPSGNAKLHMWFGDNRRVIEGLDEVVGAGEKGIGSITVRGYTSPEGTEAENTALAAARARELADHIVGLNGRLDGRVTARGMGEDWGGLREAVAASGMADRVAVLEAIDGNSGGERRKEALMKISDGRAWRELMEGYFPALRRIECVVAGEAGRGE